MTGAVQRNSSGWPQSSVTRIAPRYDALLSNSKYPRKATFPGRLTFVSPYSMSACSCAVFVPDEWANSDSPHCVDSKDFGFSSVHHSQEPRRECIGFALLL